MDTAIRRMIFSIGLFIATAIDATDYSPFDIVYHGSPTLFDQVEPRPATATDPVKNVSWEGTAIFGTFDKRIALFYTHNRVKGYTTDIDLLRPAKIDEPIVFMISGGDSLQEAVEALWGSETEDKEATGYIYLLDGRHFVYEPGLGEMERICRHAQCNIGRVPVHRRRELEHYRSLGLIDLKWKP